MRKQEKQQEIISWLESNKNIYSYDVYYQNENLIHITIVVLPNYDDERFKIEIDFPVSKMGELAFYGDIWYKQKFDSTYFTVHSLLSTPAGTIVRQASYKALTGELKQAIDETIKTYKEG